MPRCGSSENVAIMVEAGLSRYGPSARKSGTPYTVVFMKLCALGLTIMARIHGSLKRSTTRTTTAPLVLGGAIEGEPSLCLAAISVSDGTAAVGRVVPPPTGSVRVAVIGFGCAAWARAFAMGSLSARSTSGNGAAAGLAIARRGVEVAVAR